MVDAIIMDIQGALEAAAAAATTHTDEGMSWPPVVDVPLIVGRASPGFGVTPPTFTDCCGWSTYSHEELAASVGVTAFAAGPLSMVADVETFLTEEVLGTIDTYSSVTGMEEDKEDGDLLVTPLAPPLSVSDLPSSDTSLNDAAEVPSLPAIGGSAGSGTSLDPNNDPQAHEPNKSFELHSYSPHSPVPHCAQSTDTGNRLLRVHSPSYCTDGSPITVECCQDISLRGTMSPVLSTVEDEGIPSHPPCITAVEELSAISSGHSTLPGVASTFSLREGLLRTSPPSPSVEVSSVWGALLSDRAPAPAHPEELLIDHSEALSSVSSVPLYTESAISRSRGTSGLTAPQEEFLQIGGPLAIALRGMCPGQVVSRVLGPPCRQGISGLRPFGNSMGMGRLRAWDLAMAHSFGSWRSLQDGRNSLAAGILLGLSEVGDIDAWMDMGRLLSTLLLTSPPDLVSLVRNLGGTGGRYALRTLTALIEKSRTVESSGELDSPTYSLTFPGIPGIRVYSPASALDPTEVDEGVIHLLSYGNQTARLYGRGSRFGVTADVNLAVGDVVVAFSHTLFTGVITRFALTTRQVHVRPIGGADEVVTSGSQTPTCPPIFGRFSLHYALAAPSFSDGGASM